VYDHVAVQIVDSLQDLSGVSAGDFLRQRSVRLQLVFNRALDTHGHTDVSYCSTECY